MRVLLQVTSEGTYEHIFVELERRRIPQQSPRTLGPSPYSTPRPLPVTSLTTCIFNSSPSAGDTCFADMSRPSAADEDPLMLACIWRLWVTVRVWHVYVCAWLFPPVCVHRDRLSLPQTVSTAGRTAAT